MMSSSGSSRIGRFDEARQRRALELGQVLAGEVADEIGGGVDGPAVDRLHGRNLSRRARDSSPVTPRATLGHDGQRRDPERPDPADAVRRAGRASSSARSARRWRRARSTTCRTRAGRSRSRTTRRRATWAMAHRMLKNAGVAPPWIEADKAVRGLLAERDRSIAAAEGLARA